MLNYTLGTIEASEALIKDWILTDITLFFLNSNPYMIATTTTLLHQYGKLTRRVKGLRTV